MSQNVNVNLVPGNYPKEFHVSQYDVGRQLVANIVDSTGAYSIPSGATVTLVGTKPSGFGFTLSGTVGSGGVVTFSTTATVTAEYGRIPCEIRITSGSTILGTANCMLIVEESPHPEGTTDGDGEVIVNQITLLLEQITQQADRAVTASEAAQASETAAAASEANAATSESNAAASEATALSAKDDAVAAKTAAQASEQAAAESAAEAEATLGSYAKVGGEYDGMTVGTAKQLLSDSTTTDTEPYIYRQTAGDGDREEVEEVVGGTVAWNQLVQNLYAGSYGGITRTIVGDRSLKVSGTTTSTDSWTVGTFGSSFAWNVGHKYLVTLGNVTLPTGSRINLGSRDMQTTAMFIAQGSAGSGFGIRMNSGVTIDVTVTPQAFDLTSMFGTTIADAIYAMEQAHAGDGVAWFRKLFPKSYYPYDAGSLQSVKPSAHVTKDADENVIGNYPLPSVELRGIPKWVNGKLSYDGDILEPNGTVTRKYGIVDLGTLNWNRNTTNQYFVPLPTAGTQYTGNQICTKYVASKRGAYDGDADKAVSITGGNVWIRDTAYPSATGTEFKTAMSGVYLVYELAAPTTETVDPYTAIQVCDPNGTEEWTDERTVQIPVGNVTKYHANLKEKLEDLPAIPSAPSANGTYTLKATVSGGAVTYQWVNG